MRWPWTMRRSREVEVEENAREAALEKWSARARLDEQQRRWVEIQRTVDHFTAEAEKALRRRR